jgi:POT family proton-dependent oligopeptide transporter
MWNIVVAGGIAVTLITAVPVFLQLRKHPQGIHILFFTEMWERFSYYGMRVLLLTYMTQHFLFSDTYGQGTYGAYTSLVYLLPLIGGFLADKYIGTRKAIAFGALLLVAGHLAMAIEQPQVQQTLTYQGQAYDFEITGRQDQRETRIMVDGQAYDYGPAEGGGIAIEGLPATSALPSTLEAGSYTLAEEGRNPLFVNIFFFAMALICMGVGFLKPNISTSIGQLYEQGDPRRDAGFTLYYFGINLGAFWAQVLCAGLGATFGWQYGFGAAGVGMLIGWLVFVNKRLLFFVPGPKQLPDHVGAPPEPELIKKPLFGPINREWLIYILAILGVGGVWLVLQREEWVNNALTISSILMLVYFTYYMIKNCSWIESQRIIVALVLVLGSTVFFALFELAGSALNQFAERNTALPNDGFFSMTSGQTQSFNGAFILILAPVFAMMWNWVNRHKLDPGDGAKFALALIQVGAGFLVLVWGAQYADESARVPLIFLALLYLLHTTGELFLSPVGLSAMTKLAPAAVVATMMATWFLGSSGAQALAAQIAKLTAQETVGGQVLDPQLALETYVRVFNDIGWLSIWIGVGLGVASPILRYMAHLNVKDARGTGPTPARGRMAALMLIAAGVAGALGCATAYPLPTLMSEVSALTGGGAFELSQPLYAGGLVVSVVVAILGVLDLLGAGRIARSAAA